MASRSLWNTAKYGLFMSLALSLWGCPREEGAVCGNGIVEVGEDCDDGNTANADACPQNCKAGIESGEAACQDNTDNDLDGSVDCDDTDCANTIVCDPGGGNETNCNDCLDDDGDGFFDCKDIDCAADPLCTGGAPAEDSCAGCSDGRDNDGNGFIDCLDFACTRFSTTPNITNVCPVENSDALCSNGIDEDGNGFADCNDFSCKAPGITACQENCSNGSDDDGDGRIDCADRTCNGANGGTVDPACNQIVFIQQIQGLNSDPGHFPGGVATVDNVFVTAFKGGAGINTTFYVQEPQGFTDDPALHPYPKNSAVPVFIAGTCVGATFPAEGDCITASGQTVEFNGLTEISSCPTITVLPAANCTALGAPPVPLVIAATGANQSPTFGEIASDIDFGTAGNQIGGQNEGFEGVLVTLQNVVATAANNAAAGNEFPVSEVAGTSIISVDDFFVAINATANQTFTSLTGIYTQFNFNNSIDYKLQPRSTADVVTP